MTIIKLSREEYAAFYLLSTGIVIHAEVFSVIDGRLLHCSDHLIAGKQSVFESCIVFDAFVAALNPAALTFFPVAPFIEIEGAEIIGMTIDRKLDNLPA